MQINTNKNVFIKGILFKNYVNLNEQEKKLVLGWRNDSRIRKFMLKNELISWQEHCDFIRKLEVCNEKIYWLVVSNESYIGSGYFYNINKNSAYWGYYVKPELIGKSYGVILEYLILMIAFDQMMLDTLKCETLKINSSVIGLHTLFGFKKIDESEEVIVMEISKDIWMFKQDELKFVLFKLGKEE